MKVLKSVAGVALIAVIVYVQIDDSKRSERSQAPSVTGMVAPAQAETPAWPVAKLPQYEAVSDTVMCNGWGWVEAGKRAWYGPPLSPKEDADVRARGDCIWTPKGTKLELAYLDGLYATVCIEIRSPAANIKWVSHACRQTLAADIRPIR